MTIHQYVVDQRLLGQVVQNVLYYDHAAEDDDIKQEITDAIAQAWIDNLESFLVEEWQLNRCIVRNATLSGVLGFPFIPVGGVVTGDGTADPIVSQVAMLVSTKGPSVPPNRTRTYLAGFAETATTDSLWGSGPISAAEDWAADVASLVTATEGTFLRQSVRWAGSPAVVVDDNPVSVVTVTAVPATQRRRRIGVGI